MVRIRFRVRLGLRWVRLRNVMCKLVKVMSVYVIFEQRVECFWKFVVNEPLCESVLRDCYAP